MGKSDMDHLEKQLRAVRITGGAGSGSSADTGALRHADGCVQQTSKKYTTRPSPPYPASSCQNQIRTNKGKAYQSRPYQREGKTVYAWRAYKGILEACFQEGMTEEVYLAALMAVRQKAGSGSGGRGGRAWRSAGLHWY